VPAWALSEAAAAEAEEETLLEFAEGLDFQVGVGAPAASCQLSVTDASLWRACCGCASASSGARTVRLSRAHCQPMLQGRVQLRSLVLVDCCCVLSGAATGPRGRRTVSCLQGEAREAQQGLPQTLRAASMARVAVPACQAKACMAMGTLSQHRYDEQMHSAQSDFNSCVL
jgi:hypothetical protein